MKKIILIALLLILVLSSSCGDGQIHSGSVVGKSFQSATIYHPMVCQVTIQNGAKVRTVSVTPEVYRNISLENWYIVD